MALYTVKQFDELAVGDRVAISKTITEADGALYIAATGDFGPVHIDDGYAASTRFGRRLAPGIMVAGLATSVLTSHLVGILGVSIEDQFWFTGPVFYGDTVTFEIWISGKDADKRVLHWEGLAHKQDGVEVLKARATLKFPRPKPAPA
jgi:3-hydroxybutyryl-CoA dehydratase